MKKALWVQILCFMLVIALVLPASPAVSAARFGRNSGNFTPVPIRNFWDLVFGREPDPEPVQPAPELTLVEGKDTVENEDLLRADTYEAAPNAVPMAAGETIKYFGSTLFNYDDRINQATYQADVDANPSLRQWDGIYFSGGNPAEELSGSFTAAPDSSGPQRIHPQFNAQGNVTNVPTGDYHIIHAQNGNALYVKTTSSGWRTTRNVCDGPMEQADVWHINNMNSSGTYQISANGYFLTIGSSISDTTTQWSSQNLTLKKFGGASGDNDLIMIQQDSYYLSSSNAAQNDGKYAGTTNASDPNATFYLVPVGSSPTTYGPFDYAGHNFWTGNESDQNPGSYKSSNGNRVYSGIAENTLTADGQIVFTHPDGGIFNSDATVKDIYTNVGIPFQYEPTTNTYTFDANAFGAYFVGGAASNKNLTYFPNPQQNAGLSVQDGRVNGWYPFNEGNVTPDTADYHFGMKTTVPFNMTANGCIDAANNRSDAIEFSFSGDDDVWVFIDGHLVLDLGGIHNGVNGTLNFRDNTWTVTAMVSSVQKGKTGDAATSTRNVDSITGKLFSDGSGESRIPMDRGTFAATEDHELTIFYLERGKGSSNCKIQFNLPLLDAVSVFKQVTQKWVSTGSGTGTVQDLTSEEQAVIDNVDFGFTLYKKSGNTFQPVANTRYSLMNADGQVISVPSTDAQGHFTLKNGQSARFSGGIPSEGVTYYVAEDNMNENGFVAPDYHFYGNAANGYDVDGVHYTSAAEIPALVLLNQTESTYDSRQITVRGGSESKDTLVFICKNYVDASLPETVAKPLDDRIVLDYGLGVQIDVLKNDLYQGDSIVLLDVGGDGMTVSEDGTISGKQAPSFGTAQIVGDHIEYQLNKQLTGVEVLTYAVKVTSTTVVAGQTQLVDAYGTANVYIIPATTMYYEEDFPGLVQFGKGNPGSAVGTPQDTYQEPGVVGTIGDSPYGSDIAYRNDSGDSNGTSHYFSTQNAAAHFRYTFTGTETSFFARTSSTSGFMRIRITDDQGTLVHEYYRNTVFKDQDNAVKGPLYNIPVYTWNALDAGLDYGTYTVTVSVAQADPHASHGSEFWLDGIRVVNPLNKADPLQQTALSAYAADGESNMTHVTLRGKLLTEANVEFVYQTNENGELIYDQDGEPIPVLDENGEPVEKLVWKDGGGFVSLTDINGALQTAEEYKSIGPKEELYLYSGQNVTFSLKNWDPNTNKMFIGMKAPTGQAQVTVGSRQMTLDNAADCYFDISKLGRISEDKTITFTISAGMDSLLSLTNLKVTGIAEFTIVDQNIDPMV